MSEAPARVPVPPRLVPVLDFSRYHRFRGAYGGRGSGKTRSFAQAAAIRGMVYASAGQSGVILCGREFMNSLDDSSMAEVKEAIAGLPWLAAAYDVGERYIRTRDGRVRFVFAGLRHSLDSIKSKARVLFAWIDEAEAVSEVAWRKLLPTVREEGSEIWVTWNPEREGSPTDARFRQHPPRDSLIVELNHHDNPWFPTALEEQRRDDRERLDPATYAHVWDGAYLENSAAQILHDKVRVAEFEPAPEWDGPYHGLDYGFSQDPTAAVRCWIHGQRLYIEQECGAVGLELDDTAPLLLKTFPDVKKYVIRADNARPESSSYLRRHGLPRTESVDKWQGSVEDGIQHLRSYREIIVHPRCVETIRECRLYSYKVDRLMGDVLSQPVDAYNHYIDAVRYALAPLIRRPGTYTMAGL